MAGSALKLRPRSAVGVGPPSRRRRLWGTSDRRAAFASPPTRRRTDPDDAIDGTGDSRRVRFGAAWIGRPARGFRGVGEEKSSRLDRFYPLPQGSGSVRGERGEWGGGSSASSRSAATRTPHEWTLSDQPHKTPRRPVLDRPYQRPKTPQRYLPAGPAIRTLVNRGGAPRGGARTLAPLADPQPRRPEPEP